MITLSLVKASLNDSILQFASMDVKVVTISYILIIKDFVPKDTGTTVLSLIVSDSHFCLGMSHLLLHV